MKSINKKINYIIFFLVSLFIISSDTYALEGTITADIGLNLRDGSIDGVVVYTLSYGTHLKVIEKNIDTSSSCNNWYLVEYDGYEYYACGDYIKIIDELSEEEKDTYRKYLKDKGFPDSYLDGLVKLHELHPNWVFNVFNADITFDEILDIENNSNGKSLLWDKYGIYDGYKSLESWSYNYLTDVFYKGYSGGGTNWYAASSNTIAYYLDPRNFFNEEQIFMFEVLGFNENIHVESGVEAMLKGTFMEGKYADSENNKTYVDAFMDSAKENNVSPYVLISRVIQEVGANGSTIVSGTVSGYEGYYNFYNIEATGQQDQIITNGLKHAKEKGWDTPYKAIVGGASFLSDDYIDEGQDTLYLQKWDLFGPYFGRHQYQQNIQAPSTESKKSYSGYNSTGLIDSEIVFSIPVFKDNSIPNSTKLDNPGNPNNYLSSLKVNDTYLFESATTDTTFTIELDKTVNAITISATKVNNKATIKGLGSVALTKKEQNVVITVIAENGDVRDYIINVKRDIEISDTEDPIIDNKEEEKDNTEYKSVKEILDKINYKVDDEYLSGIDIGTEINSIINKIKDIDNSILVTLYDKEEKEKKDGIITSGDKINIKLLKEEVNYTILIKGDVNGDGAIDKLDALAILRYYYGYIDFNSLEKKAANINNDKNIDKLDALAVLRDLYGYEKITQ